MRRRRFAIIRRSLFVIERPLNPCCVLAPCPYVLWGSAEATLATAITPKAKLLITERRNVLMACLLSIRSDETSPGTLQKVGRDALKTALANTVEVVESLITALHWHRPTFDHLGRVRSSRNPSHFFLVLSFSSALCPLTLGNFSRHS